MILLAASARVRLVAPSTLLPPGIARLGFETFTSMEEGLKDADIVMMLRLQHERMNGSFVPSVKEYFRFYGLDQEKLAFAKPDALVMHPGPMNRGVEISSTWRTARSRSSASRSKWASPCAWRCWRLWRAICRTGERRHEQPTHPLQERPPHRPRRRP